MTHDQTAQLMDDFVNDRIAPKNFDHRRHVEAAYALLRHNTFFEAAAIYARGLEKLAVAGGAPEKFNVTISMAYLGLIAERISENENTTWDEFIARNNDLLDKGLLLHWYKPDRLWSNEARKLFLMPAATHLM